MPAWTTKTLHILADAEGRYDLTVVEEDGVSNALLTGFCAGEGVRSTGSADDLIATAQNLVREASQTPPNPRGGRKPSAGTARRTKAVLDTLENQGPKTALALAEEVGTTLSLIRYSLTDLRKQGRVHKGELVRVSGYRGPQHLWHYVA